MENKIYKMDKIKIGDTIKVIEQEIYGEVIKLHPTEVVIFDADINDWLCFKLTEVEEIK